MKQIFENLKGVLLPVLVFAGLIALIIPAVFPAIKETVENQEKRDYSAYQDAAAYKETAARKAPVIIYNNEKIWKTGSEIFVEQAFVAKDSEGSPLAVKVMGIEDSAGTDFMDKYDKAGKKVVFDKAGSYYFRLKAVDKEKKTAVKTIALVVDN